MTKNMAKTIAATMLTLTLAAATSFAADDGIRVSEAWARATPGLAKTGAIYLSITNAGNAPDRLIAASTPVAEKAELHRMTVTNGVMEMRPLDAVILEPGKSVVLAPNGNHIMLIGLKAALKEGDTLLLTLTFEHADKQEVIVSVTKIGAMQGGEMSKMPSMSNMRGMPH